MAVPTSVALMQIDDEAQRRVDDDVDVHASRLRWLVLEHDCMTVAVTDAMRVG